jgi:YVTN family beta-propeller protein/VCBS repeat-containing protein
LVPRSAQSVSTRRVDLRAVGVLDALARPGVAQPATDSASSVLAASADLPQMVATPAQPAAASDVVESVLSTVLGSNPDAPVGSPTSWLVVTAARRELGQMKTAEDPAVAVWTDQVMAPALAAVPLTAAAVAISPTGANASVISTIAVGASPFGVVFNRAGTRAYVASQSDGTVSVINTADSTVAATIFAGQGPSGVALNADGSRAYVTNFIDNSVSVIDTATNTVIATIGVGSSPMGVAVSPNGSRVLVANFGGASVSVIETATNTVTATVAVGSSPAGVAFSPGGNRAWVTNFDSNSVSLIKMVNLKVKKTVALSSSPFGVAVIQGRAYVTTKGGNLEVINTSTKQVMGTTYIGSASASVAMSADGTTLYATDYQNGTLAFISTATNQITNTIAVGYHPVGVALSRDGTRIYVANQGDNTVSVIGANYAPAFGTPSVSSPDATTGVVIGQINATDRDGDTLTFSAPTTTAKGAVTINASTGAFTYNPNSAARLNAGKAEATAADRTDTFTVTVTDSSGGSAAIQVTVAVSSRTNTAPAAGTVTLGTPDIATGAVSGTVRASDADNDLLTYTGPTTTAKGSVAVAANGSFIYTPTSTARHAAAKNGASTSTTSDTFSIVASDGVGGSLTIPVTITIAPANAAPTLGTLQVNKPDVSNGVVMGTLIASDLDGDAVTYTGATSTSSGKITLSRGAFTYTPTPTAREAATASTTDTFTITASDSYGGSVAVPVTVRVLPKPTVVQGIPNLTTGIVTGSVTAPNFTNGPLVYDAPTVTSKGALFIDRGTGAFTYTPTAVARHNASATNATDTDKVDTFTVTISDSQGEVQYAELITVTLRPTNLAPTGSFTAGGLDPNIGVITGSVLGLDGDRDVLTYRGSSVTAQGRVVVDGTTGTFTYTPVARVDTVTSVISGFNSPSGVVFSRDGSRAYVTNSKGNSVSVVDTSTKTVVTIISGVANPTALAITPDGSRIYVVGTNSVSIVDTATNTVSGAISGLAPTGASPAPKAVAVSPDGTLVYVASSTGVSVVDTVNNAVAATIGTSLYTSVTFSPDGKRAYLGGTYYSYSAIDTATNTLVSSSFNSPRSYAFSPAGDRVYGLDAYGSVAVRDSAQNPSTSSAASTARALAISRDGSLLYGLGTKGEIVLFDAATTTLLGTANYACASCGTSSTAGSVYPNGIAVSPDGNTVYAVNPVNGTVSVVTGWVGPTTDTFNVTVDDGHGATITVPVTVSFVG